MKMKDTFLITLIVWFLALDEYDIFKYLVLVIVSLWLILNIVKFKIRKSINNKKELM